MLPFLSTDYEKTAGKELAGMRGSLVCVSKNAKEQGPLEVLGSLQY